MKNLLFYDQTSLKETLFSVLKSGVKFSLIGLRNALRDIYFLTLQYIEWATHQIFCDKYSVFFRRLTQNV